MSHHRKSWDIVGYSFRAANYCPDCITIVLPTGPGQAFDGWGLAPGVQMSTEDNLNELAAAFSIDRMDEGSFDSDDFPKVIFRDQVERDEVHNLNDTCESCLKEL